MERTNDKNQSTSLISMGLYVKPKGASEMSLCKSISAHVVSLTLDLPLTSRNLMTKSFDGVSNTQSLSDEPKKTIRLVKS